MTKLVVRLLGGYSVELDGKAVYAFETDKARALLAYLLVEAGRPHRRETLASLFWPERPEAVARTNLRQTIARVRRALREQDTAGCVPRGHETPPFLLVTRTDVQFNTSSDYALDVVELERVAHVTPRWRAGELDHSLQLLPEAFCADFLAGFAVPDSVAFQAWVLIRQERYHRLALAILEEEVACFERMGDYQQAANAARLQLQLEPWLEAAHRHCMRSLTLAGRSDEALHQYEVCRCALAAELGVEPSRSTQALYTAIQAGRLARGIEEPPPRRGAGPCSGLHGQLPPEAVKLS